MISLGAAFSDFVAREPHRHAITVPLADGSQKSFTRQQLFHQMNGWAALMRSSGISANDHIVVVADTNVDFVASFWAVQHLGATAVPFASFTQARRLPQQLNALADIVSEIRPRAIICHRRDANHIQRRIPSLPILTEEQIEERNRNVEISLHRHSDEMSPAFIQFTSGSTGRSKGCILSHLSVIENAKAIAARTKAESSDIAVCWLPLNHDMGLMSGVIVPVISQIGTHLVNPAKFMLSPLSWLEILSGDLPSHSAVPNFALSLVLRRLEMGRRIEADLSRVKTIMCGAELIDPAIARRFTDRLAFYGLRKEVFHAAYGMSETTVMATSRPGGLKSIFIESRNIAIGTSISVLKYGEGDCEIVSVGRPVLESHVRIVSAEGEALPELYTGIIEFKGPSVMRGYIGDTGSISTVFNDGWLHTNDIGFIYEEDLYILGRSDDVIIVRGENIYPVAVEQQIAELVGIDPSRLVLAERKNELGTTEIFVVVEARPNRIAADFAANLIKACGQICGHLPADVMVLSPGQLPRTTSGKVKRSELRYLENLTSDVEE